MPSLRRPRTLAVVALAIALGAAVGVGGVGVLDSAVGSTDQSASADGPQVTAHEPTVTGTESPPSTPSDDATAHTATPAPSEAANTTWQEYRLVVVFRNDDIQPSYEFSTMKAVDRVFVTEDVPVTNAVIPFLDGTAISSDEETCTYLRELGHRHPNTFEFAVHGYSHENRAEFFGGSEFGSIPYDTQREWIAAGADELSTCTGTRPTTFVPPMNTYDENTTRAVADSELEVVSGGSWFTRSYYGETGVFRNGSVVHVASTNDYVKNWTTMETKSRAELESEFDESYAEGGTYAMMIHYPDFDTPERRADLRALLRHAKSHDGVRFMTVGEVGSRRSNGTMVRTDEGWRVLEGSA